MITDQREGRPCRSAKQPKQSKAKPYLRAVGWGLEPSGEDSGGCEPLAAAEVVLERELQGVGLAGAWWRRVRRSAAGGGDRRGYRRGRRGGAGADALKLLVVVEDELVGLEGSGCEVEGEEEESGEGEESAARRRHGEERKSAAEDGEAWSGLGREIGTDRWDFLRNIGVQCSSRFGLGLMIVGSSNWTERSNSQDGPSSSIRPELNFGQTNSKMKKPNHSQSSNLGHAALRIFPAKKF